MSHITELSRTLIGRGLVQSLSRSSLRTQGPITPDLESEKRPLLECRSESPRRRDERFALTLGSLRFAGTTMVTMNCQGFGFQRAKTQIRVLAARCARALHEMPSTE